MRIGKGYDVHRLGPDRDLIIGGIKIPYELGLVGHSDADVAAATLNKAHSGFKPANLPSHKLKPIFIVIPIQLLIIGHKVDFPPYCKRANMLLII